jgi:hypothetical protein
LDVELVNGAHESNPHNRELLSFIDGYREVATSMRHDALERLSDELRPLVDVVVFRDRLAQIEKSNLSHFLSTTQKRGYGVRCDISDLQDLVIAN